MISISPVIRPQRLYEKTVNSINFPDLNAMLSSRARRTPQELASTDEHRLAIPMHVRSSLISLLLALTCAATPSDISAEAVNESSERCKFSTQALGSDKTVLIGRVVGQPDATDSAILIENRLIQQIGDEEDIRALAPDARVLECKDVYISPGFINPHEHPRYSSGKPGPNVAPVYTNRYQWQGRAGDQHKVISYAAVENDAQLYWVEVRHLLAGTTTLAGNGAVQGLIKNIGSGDPQSGFVYHADLKTFPFPDAVDKFKQLSWPYDGRSIQPELSEGVDPTSPYVPHIAEGIDKISNFESEFFLDYVEANPGRRYAMIHGVGLRRESVSKLSSLDVTLVWAPRSNLALYGETVDVPYLIENRVRVAISTDWSYSGSYNLLESFKCARHINNEKWANQLSDQELWRMATKNGAYALNLEQTIGVLKPGFAADLIVVRARSDDMYADLVSSEVSDILATFVDGELVTGSITAFNSSELPSSCTNFVGDHFICDDISRRNFTWQQLLREKATSVPLFMPDGQASCAY